MAPSSAAADSPSRPCHCWSAGIDFDKSCLAATQAGSPGYRLDRSHWYCAGTSARSTAGATAADSNSKAATAACKDFRQVIGMADPRAAAPGPRRKGGSLPIGAPGRNASGRP